MTPEPELGGPAPPSRVGAAFAELWPVLVADLVRRHGDLALAEDAVADAFAEAVRAWDVTEPENPGGWLRVTARRRAVDRLRRESTAARHRAALAADRDATERDAEAHDAGPGSASSDQLALLFGCCHPCLGADAQVALTLRAVNGLSTAEIARIFLTSTDTMTRRLTRARTKLAANAIPFRIPEPERWAERLVPVLDAIYLTFTAGHSSEDHGSSFVRGDLCDEARWLAALVASVAPEDPEVLGLTALMDLTDARRAARTTADGDLVPLSHQDRSLWDRALLARGREHLRRAVRQRRLGTFQIEAALSAAHAMAPTWEDTDWPQIVVWYDALVALHPSSINRLNRAVALSMADRAHESLVEVDALVDDLADHHYLWLARAEALERLARPEEAIEAVERARALGPHPSHEREMQRRLGRLRASAAASTVSGP